jgi:hypothetical protein
MSLHVRPAAIVAAPLEVVWELAQPAHRAGWPSIHLVSPVGKRGYWPATSASQRIVIVL